MKCALIYPEMYELSRYGTKRKEFPPFGVLYLAAALEKAGDKVDIFTATEENVAFDFLEYDAVGFSISASCAYNLIKNVKKYSKFSESCIIFSGGIHTTLFPEQVIEELDLNIAFIGESDESIVEFSDRINSNNNYYYIAGTCVNNNGKIIRYSARELINDINRLEFPARHLLDVDKIVMENRLAGTDYKIAHIMASRGCIYNCYFCANQDKKIRYRTGVDVKNELELLKSQFQIEGFCITDDNFIINTNNVKEICNEIKPLNLKWSALSRVDTVNKDTMEIMFKSGCIELKFGIESGSEAMLSKMNKNISLSQIRKAIITAKEVGINVKVFLIHGFPGENMSTTLETVSLLNELKTYIDRVSLFKFVPLPGSYVFNNPQKFNLKNIDNFNRLYIYNDDIHWWGENNDFIEVKESFELLNNFINDNWGINE